MDIFVVTHALYDRDSTQNPIALDKDIPDELLALLGQGKGNSYANGFFRFIAPDRFRDYFSLWDLAPLHCTPFLKCAFGHLIFYHQQQYKVLNPVYNCIDILGEKEDLDLVMNIILCDRPSLESSFCIDVYEQVFPRLGSPQPKEIYAFVPALGLGGSRDAECVRKVKMQEQMIILSQL